MATIEESIKSGLLYLRRECDKVNGFQINKVGKERIHLATCWHPVENLTSIYALDFIGDLLDPRTKKRIAKLLKQEDEYAPIVAFKNIYKVSKADQELRDYYENEFPNDVDVTSVLMLVYLRDGVIEKDEKLIELAKVMIGNVDKNGVIQTYLPPRVNRNYYKNDWEEEVDGTVCCNVMRFLYTLGLGDEATLTEDYLLKHLEEKNYLEMTANYVSPDIFLFFLARAINCNAKAKERFLGPLTAAIKERMCITKFPLDISARILTLNELGLLNDEELKESVETERRLIKSFQDSKGAFKEDCLFKKEIMCAFYGGKALSNIFAIAALRCFLEKKDPNE